MSLRPEEWNKWTLKSRSGNRRYDALPFIQDSAELGIAVAKWWSAMQPAFRRSAGNIPASVYETDDSSLWDPLRKSGPSGLVSVMTLMTWWGQALLDRTQYQMDSTSEWRQMVADIKACMIAIASTTDTTKKRKAAGERVNNRKRYARNFWK